MKKIKLLYIHIVLLALACTTLLQASETITLTASEDAHIQKINTSGYEHVENTNYGQSKIFRAYRWTMSGGAHYSRSLVNFDFSVIPDGAQIVSATIYLYAYDGGSPWISHINDIITGNSGYKPNTSNLRRITSPWDEHSVTWNNQPSATTTNQATIPNSTSEDQDYTVNVTNLVQDVIDNRHSSYGFLMILQNEVQYTNMAFASKEHEDVNKHIKLEITYNRPSYNLNLSSSKNYIHVVTPLKSMSETQVPGPSSSRTLGDVADQVTYYDGLNRPLQSISVGASPGAYDIVSPHKYDQYGRQPKNYMPYTLKDQSESGSGIGGNFRSHALTGSKEQEAFYNNRFPGEGQYANTEKTYDGSPINRVKELTGPGQAWHTANKAVKKDVKPHSSGNIPIWNWVSTSGSTQKSGSNYGSNNTRRLMVSETEDEDGNTVKTYTTSSGQKILKEVYNNGGEVLKTRYLYDGFGRLRYIIPPKAMETDPSSLSKTSSLVQNLCYYYEYDGKGRVIEKSEPGAGKTSIVYDNLDRPVMTRDANQLSQNPHKWSFVKYDRLGRPIISGIYSGSVSRATLQSIFNGGSYALYEQRGSASEGYTNNAFPNNTSYITYMKVTYYDNYNSLSSGHDFTTLSTSGLGPAFNGFPTTYSSRIKGAVTYTKVRVLNPNGIMPNWLYSAAYYDDKGRVIQTIGDNHVDGKDYMSYKYDDFTGQLLATIQKHASDYIPGGITIGERYVYDHAGRELQTYHQIAGEPEVLLRELAYNELGQVVEKRVHYNLQDIDYKYNIRGSLTHINDPEDLNGDIFGMELMYENPTGLGGVTAPAQYNGNVSAMKWKNSEESELKAYGFRYDKAGRLLEADYGEGTSSISDKSNMYNVTGPSTYNSDIQYDANGNITRLERDGSGGSIDELEYEYYTGTNQLKYVDDQYGTSAGFDQNDFSGTSYEYDANGNITKDLNKSISNISYNFLNLPEIVTMPSQVHNFAYDAVGNKLRYRPSGTIDYVGNLVFGNGSAPDILTSEGRITGYSGNYSYEYYLTDHLGNTRGVINQASEILQVSNYYPFGMRHEPVTLDDATLKYLYQGKEMHPEMGLYDFGSRFYDPALARWGTIDPQARKFAGMTPYGAMGNNPVTYIDPDGESIIGFIVLGAIIGGYVNVGVTVTTGRDESLLASFAKGSIVGAATGAASIGAAAVAAQGLSAATSVTGGVIGGATTGAAGGFAGGFVGGAGNAWMYGADFNEGLAAGWDAGKMGALGGLAIGGALGGLSTVGTDANLFTGNTPSNLLASTVDPTKIDPVYVYAYKKASLPIEEIATVSSIISRGIGSDGLTITEAVDHARYGGGTPVDVPLSKVDLSKVRISDFDADGYLNADLGTTYRTNWNDAVVHGTIRLEIVKDNMVRVAPGSDVGFNFEMHYPWKDNFSRNVKTLLLKGYVRNNRVFGYEPFEINYQGVVPIQY